MALRRARLSASATVLALASLAAPEAAARELTIAADPWCPYNCEPGTDRPGYVVELAREIFGEAGHTIDYRSMPWSRALEWGVSGKVDGVIAVSTEPEGEQMIKPEEPLGYYQVTFYTRASSDWTYDGIESLKSQTLNVIQDYAYFPEVDDYIAANADTALVESDPTPLKANLRQVRAGRADVTLDDRAVADYTLDQMGAAADFRVAGTAGEPLALYLAWSQAVDGAADYARIWTEGVRALRDSGRLDDILARYGVSDWSD